MLPWFRRRTKRVAPELVRPLVRVGGEKELSGAPHERVVVTLLAAAVAVGVAADDRASVARLIGLVVVTAGAVFLAGRYFLKHEREAVSSLRRLAAIEGLSLIVLLLARMARDGDPFSLLLVPVPALAVLFALLVSPRFAIADAALLLALVALIAWDSRDLPAALLMLGGGAVAGALYSFRVRKPSRLLAIGAIVGVTQLLALASLALVRTELPASAPLLERLALGFAHGIATGVVVLGLLPVVEKLLDRLSDLTLLEYSNQNEQPVLLRLLQEAPGTHYHSVQVGSLAEAAAEAIGANSLLCRVGAYFHDIGKMNKPEYFSENSQNARTLHGGLSPDMSKLVITAHPKDGIELARIHRIPRPIQSFIEEHHGTTAVEYFYRLKVKQNPDEEISKESYRYAGPRPRTRETAIVMIADSVEAASRTLREFAPARLEQLIDDIVAMKMEDGQLEECPLNLRELTRIKEAFLHVLVGIYHKRPAYPRDPTGRLAVPLAETELVPEIESGRAPERRRAPHETQVLEAPERAPREDAGAPAPPARPARSE
jgi:putative nucleotidyltransferase with HDIG domain